MAEVITINKKIHKNCGGEIELVALSESFRHLVRCKKCDEKWKMPLDESEEGNENLL